MASLSPVPPVLKLSSAVYPWEEIRDLLSSPVTFPEMHVDVFRHGQSVANLNNLITGKSDVDLTQVGREQARSIGQTLSDTYSLACSSSLRRSYETLRIALDCGGVRVGRFHADPRLDERSLGILELRRQRPIAEFARGDLRYAPPGGESYLELTRRILSFMIDLVRVAKVSPQPLSVVISTHVGPMRIFCGVLWGVRSTSDLLALHFENAAPVRACFGKLEWPVFLIEELHGDKSFSP